MMKDWEKQFDEWRNNGEHESWSDKYGYIDKLDIEMVKEFIRSLLNQYDEFFRQTGKQGGEATKKKADYSAMGKKGAAKRWNVKRK